MRKLSNEIKVGSLFIACVIGLIYLTVSTGKFHIKDKGYNIYVAFDDIAGIEKNSPVMFNGLEIGRVQDIKVSYKDSTARIILKLLIPQNIKVGDNPLVSIKTLGFMGEKYVHISSPQRESFLEANALLEGRNPGDMDAIFSEAQILSKNINAFLDTAEDLIANLNSTVEENSKSITKSITNISEITERVNSTLKKNQEYLDQIVYNLRNATRNFEEFSKDIKKNPWKLLFKEKGEK
ncbi:MAG: MlaD family protein [Candidatus Omnitrophota bacterium]